MLRGLISTVFLVGAASLGALFYIYGEVEPCKVLAKEYQMRAEDEGVDIVAGMVRLMGLDPYRLETSQYSSGECTEMLFSSWRQRLES